MYRTLPKFETSDLAPQIFGERAIWVGAGADAGVGAGVGAGQGAGVGASAGVHRLAVQLTGAPALVQV